MQSSLYDLLVNKEADQTSEIKRLAIFRGLNIEVEEKDLKTFLERYFGKDSVIEQEVFYYGHNEKWAKCFASNRLQDNYVDSLDLDPFVARYVLAINKIGIKTYLSCDGWHKLSGNQLLIGFKERYSRIWHKIICSYFKDYIPLNWKYDGNVANIDLPKNDKGKINTYINVNKNAELFELHQKELLKLKENVILTLKGQKKNSLTDDEIEVLLINAIKVINNK